MVAIQESIEAISFRFKHLTFSGALWIYTVYMYVYIYTHLVATCSCSCSKNYKNCRKSIRLHMSLADFGLGVFQQRYPQDICKTDLFWFPIFIQQQNPYHPWDWYISPHEMVDFYDLICKYTGFVPTKMVRETNLPHWQWLVNLPPCKVPPWQKRPY